MDAPIDKYTELINKYRINPLAEESEPPSYCLINNRPTFTAGNFSLINGKKKAGKTFLLGGVIASAINNSLQIGVIKGNLPDNKNVILYFDTEQGPYHATRSIKRICSLAGNPNPDNLLAFGLRPMSPEGRLKYIEEIISNTKNVGLVAIDGIRDLLTMGINDEREATQLTSLFLKWSFDYNIHIILLLHQNKNDVNPRGHIGTEVVNKAESIISVTKEEKGKTFRVVCEDSRDLPFDDFGFSINDDGLPISSNISETRQRKVTDPQYITDEKHLTVLKDLYKAESEYSYSELTKALSEEFNIGLNLSKKFLTHYKEKGWFTTERKGTKVYYTLNQDNAHSFFSN